MTASTEMLAPPTPPGPIAWLRKNLFSDWFNALLTILSLTIILFGSLAILKWVFISADWRPVTRAPLLYLIGQYPRDQFWRLALSLLLLTFLIGLSWGVWEKFVKAFAIFLGLLLGVLAIIPLETPTVTLGVRAVFLANLLLIYLGYRIGRLQLVKSRHVATLWLLVSAVIVLALLPGFESNPMLPRVPTTAWGGLLVTLLLAVGGIVLSFPVGVLLALGRRSSLPVVKLFSILFIEVVRGVPLITILFMFSIILALFLPAESRIDRVIRALIGIVVFSAAYTAENVRGGLQAIPQGQVEAA
ncbi:MAG: ABC transporter permease subunit, partial [Anaerolineales bacterium]|nr:ABC transporter permease subunit [Anaerolineales bacterium]